MKKLCFDYHQKCLSLKKIKFPDGLLLRIGKGYSLTTTNSLAKGNQNSHLQGNLRLNL